NFLDGSTGEPREEEVQMYTPRHAGPPRRRTGLAALGIAALALATAGTLATAGSGPAAPRPPAPSSDAGSQPMDLAVATYAHRGYVADDASVSVVDTTSHRLLSTVPTGLTDQTAISLVQAGSKVYVGSFTSRH